MSKMNAPTHVAAGMPPLEERAQNVSPFEFWPTWMVYLPVLLQWPLLSIRYGSLSLPLIANPGMPLSGMVGFSKSDVLGSATREAREHILPFVTHEVAGDRDAQLAQLTTALDAADLALPLVGKPDMGCRGAGVQLLETREDIDAYLAGCPTGSRIILQKLSRWEPEAGIFYIRHPGEPEGRISSLALKYSPYVVGDGESTLRELISRDARAGSLMHLYESRHQNRMNDVIPEGEPFRLVFAASHCRGAVFREGGQYITEELTRKLDQIMSGLPDFYYGRLDVKFRDVEGLMKGEDLEIVEINGASSESLHNLGCRSKHPGCMEGSDGAVSNAVSDRRRQPEGRSSTARVEGVAGSMETRTQSGATVPGDPLRS